MAAIRNLPSKKVLVVWTKKITYSLLVFWICGVGPLIYIERSSPHYGVQPYHVSVLGKSTRYPKLPPALVEALAQHLNQGPAGWVTPQPQFVSQHLTPPGTPHFFLSSFQNSHLLSADPITIFNDTSPSGRVLLITLSGRSVWLPPPEKPPPFYRG